MDEVARADNISPPFLRFAQVGGEMPFVPCLVCPAQRSRDCPYEMTTPSRLKRDTSPLLRSGRRGDVAVSPCPLCQKIVKHSVVLVK